MEGRIVTINDAAMELLGCPMDSDQTRWSAPPVGNSTAPPAVWEIIPVDNLRFRLTDSLTNGAKHYVPEQSLKVALMAGEDLCRLVIQDSDTPQPISPLGRAE